MITTGPAGEISGCQMYSPFLSSDVSCSTARPLVWPAALALREVAKKENEYKCEMPFHCCCFNIRSCGGHTPRTLIRLIGAI